MSTAVGPEGPRMSRARLGLRHLLGICRVPERKACTGQKRVQIGQICLVGAETIIWTGSQGASSMARADEII